jgi:hypothetical protein
LKAGELLPTDDFILIDKEREKKLGLNLKKSLAKAKANNRKLLDGETVFCTSNVQGGFDTFKAIVEANGGECRLFRGSARGGLDTQVSSMEHGNSGDHSSVVLVTNEQDKNAWIPFVKMVEAKRHKASIYGTDWLLDLAMKQEIVYDESYSLLQT